MTKLYTGSAINYGSQLPALGQVPDGHLFFKTDDINGTTGLYLFGFQQDANAGVIGEQVGQGWTRVSSIADFVLKSGDTMTGALTVPNPLRVIQEPAARILLGNQTGGGLNKPLVFEAQNGALYIGHGGSWTDGGAISPSTALYINASNNAGLQFRGGQVWHENNDGAGSTLDAGFFAGQLPSYYLAAGNHTGTIGVSRGGTGTTTTIQGGVVFGASTSTFGTTAAGTAGQVLTSSGTAAPIWSNISGLSVGNAATATVASTVIVTADATNAARYLTFVDGTGGAQAFKLDADLSYNPSTNVLSTTVTQALSATNATNATNATLAVKANTLAQAGTGVGMTFSWLSNEGGMQPTWLWGGFDGVNHYVYNPANFSVNHSATSALASNSLLLGNLAATVIPSATSIVARDSSGHVFANYLNSTAPNSENPTIAQVWVGNGVDSYLRKASIQNFSSIVAADTNLTSRYVAKAGDTMTGTLNVNKAGGASTDITISSNGSLSLSGSVISGIGVIAPYFTNNVGGGVGYTRLTQGSGSATGYIEFFNASSTRLGYVGYGSGTALSYVAEGGLTTHFFTGAIQTNSTINAAGNITAYSSDARLKKNIQKIENAVEKVQQLGGYTYDWDLEKCEAAGFKPEREHEHGLIAQEVELVVPDAVAPAPFDNEYKTIRYDRLVALLVAAVSDQQKQIADLTARLQKLED